MMAIACLACSAHADDFFFDSAGVRIHYILEGKGEPVVLVHGFGANIAVNWGKPGIIQALARSYQVIALDDRGHGQSEKPHDPEAYRGQMAEDVIRLMDHLKIKQAHVVGYSLGGFITMTLLATHPERLRSAIVAGAGWSATGLGTYQPMIDRLAVALEQGQGLGPLVTMLAPGGDTPAGGEPIEAANRALLARNDPVALAAVLRSMFADQPSEATLRANKVPVLALVGEQDLMHSWAEALARTAPNVELRVIPGANHLSAPTNPEFLSRLQTFLAQQSTK
ncbi:MAG TPA: alpha/beta hydrolase [Bryobacteraceae bacterium]|nr:alpha/beta hydrolase [Bryobacteraceae bacterium]